LPALGQIRKPALSTRALVFVSRKSWIWELGGLLGENSYDTMSIRKRWLLAVPDEVKRKYRVAYHDARERRQIELRKQ
jgi:hypothetical protein